MAIRPTAVVDPLEANADYLIPGILLYALYYAICGGLKVWEGVMADLRASVIINAAREGWLITLLADSYTLL